MSANLREIEPETFGKTGIAVGRCKGVGNEDNENVPIYKFALTACGGRVVANCPRNIEGRCWASPINPKPPCTWEKGLSILDPGILQGDVSSDWRKIPILRATEDADIPVEWKFDPAGLLLINDNQIVFTPKETIVFRCLWANLNRVVTKEFLYSRAWDDIPGSNTLECCMTKIRKKLQPLPPGYEPIKARRGIGYLFNVRNGDLLFQVDDTSKGLVQ